MYITLVINKGVVNRYMFIAPFAFIKKGNLNVGITLKHNKLLLAAPCAAFIAGLIWDKVYSRVAVASIFIGMICGLIAYFMIPDDNINYFVGNVFSLCVPIVVIMIGSLFEKEQFKLFILIVYVWFAIGIAVISVFAIRELFSWFKVPNEHISQSIQKGPRKNYEM